MDQLGSPALSWRDLLVIVRNAPQGSDLRAIIQGYPSWTSETLMLGAIGNLIHSYMWSNADPAKRGLYQPLIDLPGPREVKKEVVKVKGIDRAKADEWLAKRRAAWATG